MPHAFANLGDQPAVFFGVVAPPGRMQEFFETVTKELADSDGPPDPERLM